MDQEVDPALRASRAMLGIVARSIAPALEEVSLPQFRVLVLLETGGPARVTDLAEGVGAVVSTFSRSLDRLEAGGWISRATGTADRREVTVSITPKGRRLVGEVSATRVAALREILDRLDGDERAVLGRAFSAFADLAGEPTIREGLVLGL